MSQQQPAAFSRGGFQRAAVHRYCNRRDVRARLSSRHGWSAALCGQAFIHPGEPQIRTSLRQYFRDAMLPGITPMSDPTAFSSPIPAGRFSVSIWNCRVAFVQALQDSAQEWHGNGKLQPRSFDWSPRPATKPLRVSPNAAAPIPALSILSGNSPGKPPAISSNRRRPGCRRTASPIEEAAA